MNLNSLLSLTLGISAALIAASSNAQVTYSSRPVYDATHPDEAVIDFNNAPQAPPSVAAYTASTSFGNVTFDAIPSVNDIEFLPSTSFGIAGTGNLVLYAFNGQFLTDSLLITLPANIFSFGLDLISPSQTVPEPYKFTIYSGTTVIATELSPSLYGNYTFFGFDSLTQPITSVAIQIANGLGNPEPVIDNFTLSATAVPEPATWSLLGLGGLGSVGMTMLRRRPS